MNTPKRLLPLLAIASVAISAHAQQALPPLPPDFPTAAPSTAPASAPAPAPAPTATAAPATTQRPTSSPSPAPGSVLLNFQNASLNDVLTYLSEEAGFVIVQEAPVSGTVNIVSRQALNAEEAVDLLNTVLIEKGYAAIRNGRILKIVNRRDAPKRDIPVNMGSDAAQIPRKDAVVTQILPLRYGEAGKLVENLRPLLSDSATISANDGSNAILLTDTQTNIRRIAQIIQALDTSVSSISTITVFPLRFADSKEVAQIITQLFAPAQGSPGAPQGQGGRRGGGFGGGLAAMFGGGANGQGASPASEARSAANRVVAVADEQSNSVITSSPEETVTVIRQMIDQIDNSITEVTDTRIFRLQNADAVELASTINTLYGDTGATSGANGNRRNQNQQQQRPQGGAAGTANQSGRAILQAKVTAVGDPRTNSLLVTAAKDSMSSIAEIVGRLDSTTAKKQHVYTHALTNADPDTLANVLRGMLGQPTTNTQTGSALQNRAAAGAAMSTTDSSLGSGSGGGRSGTR